MGVLKFECLVNEQRKHPHIIFEARTKIKQMCANTGLEWGRGGRGGKGPKMKGERMKRDVREVTKYVETALVLDKAMVRAIEITTSTSLIVRPHSFK